MIQLKVGDPAPAFKAQYQTGKILSLKNFKGKKLALYLYPQDDTPVCTVQACNFCNNYSTLKKRI